MITDDPGTPGNGKWEINLAVAFEHRSGETSAEGDSPNLDAPGSRGAIVIMGGRGTSA